LTLFVKERIVTLVEFVSRVGHTTLDNPLILEGVSATLSVWVEGCRLWVVREHTARRRSPEWSSSFV